MLSKGIHILSNIHARGRRPTFGKKWSCCCSTAAVRSPASVVCEKVIANQSNKYFDKSIEADMYQWWEHAGYFKPTELPGRPSFVIPMPPPNVTGSLHMGHALFVTLQDIFVRYRRMSGYDTLWLPGTDHAGIATQMVVEKELATRGESRRDMSRDEFVERVWEWKHKTGGYITRQLRLLGASADWSREKFTLDGDICEAVVEAFIKLHDRGLVYRSDSYMVHWSPVLQTALSDLEVEYSEEEGWLYTFRYPLAPLQADDEGEFIPISTTRPETLLGDTAICVSPEDSRYAGFIGRHCVVPFSGRKIPVLADASVDPEFGTGALKVTPAHDPVDYAIGERHSLPRINIMNKDGTLNEVGDVSSNGVGFTCFQGMDRFVAREKMWSDLEANGMSISREKYLQRVPRSQRSGEVIESMVSPQWFVSAAGMAAKASHCVESKQLTLIPERYEKTWYNWLGPDKIKDWCISRQLWWGHRIPVYYTVGSQKSQYVAARSIEEATEALRTKYELTGAFEVEQEEDVLDTWFSSGLWPFATVGWPHELAEPGGGENLKRFFPATLLETGHDILFFWVARMVMLSVELTGQIPFHTVYLHGLVTDAKGQKMSKTKGNVIDPVQVIEEYGTDVLRFSLITASSTTHDIALSPKHFDITKTFVTKVWNLGKFMDHMLTSSSGGKQLEALSAKEQSACITRAHSCLGALAPGLCATSAGSDAEGISGLATHMSLADRVMVLKAHALVRSVTEALLDTPPGCTAGAYCSPTELLPVSCNDNGALGGDSGRLHTPQVSEAARAVYDFMWGEYAAWFVEINKVQLAEACAQGDRSRRDAAIVVNCYIWLLCLKMLHPFAPFITESLWISFFRNRGTVGELAGVEFEAEVGSIMLSQWPGVKLDRKEIIPMHPSEYPSICPPGTATEASDVSETQLLDDYSVFQSLVRAVRNIKAEHKVDPSRRVADVVVCFPPDTTGENAVPQTQTHSEDVQDVRSLGSMRLSLLMEAEKASLEGLSKCRVANMGMETVTDAGLYATAIAERGVVVYVPLNELRPVQNSTGGAGGTAVVSEKETLRLQKQKQKLMTQIAQLEERLSPTHPYFLKAKKSNIEQTRVQLAKAQAELDSFR